MKYYCREIKMKNKFEEELFNDKEKISIIKSS